MTNMKRIRRCNHCGVVLQRDDKEKKGYISIEYEKMPLDQIVYCDDCFNMMQVNIGEASQTVSNDVLTILRDAVATDALIVYVIDLFLHNGSLKAELIKRIRHNKVLVIGSKRDLLPEKASDEKIKEFIYTAFKNAGVEPVDVILVSASKNYQIDLLKEKINECRQKHDVYVIGSSLSGKTTIIDKLLMNFENKTKKQISSELYPNTNSLVLHIPLDKSSSLYQLPGFELDDTAIGLVEKNLWKYIIPKKEIKPRKFKVSEGETIVVGGLGAISVDEGKNADITAYFAETVELKKMASKNTDSFFKTNLVRKDLRPVSELITSFINFDLYEIVLPTDGEKYDIGVKGLGWFAIKANGQRIRCLVPRKTAIREAKSKI